MENTPQYIFDAIDMVTAWDLPEEDFAEAVNAQAHLMSGCSPDYYTERAPDTSYQ